MKDVILFPGQGAQFEGMGRDWCEAHEVARDTFQEADEALGFALSASCWTKGEQVNRTDIAQPGILTTSVAIMRVLERGGYEREAAGACAGLSLGEYTALWAAGAIGFVDALRLVRLRGEAMQAASESIPSGMISLMGADEATAAKLAEVGSAAGICQVANLNAPGQTIVSGELAALDAVEAAAAEHGVRRTRRLVVAGGFHSECMRPAADRLTLALQEVEIKSPRIPVISNVTARAVGTGDEIRELLARQVCSSVRWEDSMRHLLAEGFTNFLEPGPGEVLGGLMRKIDREAGVRSVATPANL